jgi:hypothetical protein
MREGVTHLVNFAFAKSLYLLGAAPLPLFTESPRRNILGRWASGILLSRKLSPGPYASLNNPSRSSRSLSRCSLNSSSGYSSQ